MLQAKFPQIKALREKNIVLVFLVEFTGNKDYELYINLYLCFIGTNFLLLKKGKNINMQPIYPMQETFAGFPHVFAAKSW